MMYSKYVPQWLQKESWICRFEFLRGVLDNTKNSKKVKSFENVSNITKKAATCKTTLRESSWNTATRLRGSRGISYARVLLGTREFWLVRIGDLERSLEEKETEEEEVTWVEGMVDLGLMKETYVTG